MIDPSTDYDDGYVVDKDGDAVDLPSCGENPSSGKGGLLSRSGRSLAVSGCYDTRAQEYIVKLFTEDAWGVSIPGLGPMAWADDSHFLTTSIEPDGPILEYAISGGRALISRSYKAPGRVDALSAGASEKMFAYAYATGRGGYQIGVENRETGRHYEIPFKGRIDYLAWLPDESALVVQRATELYLVPAGEGTARPPARALTKVDRSCILVDPTRHGVGLWCEGKSDITQISATGATKVVAQIDSTGPSVGIASDAVTW
ncbi:hypothetical protein [Sphaerisporangium album]|uniref:hypothetical protein n=1 Tax=Sphaerisporangium album TaxID=509200 RepID=UPI0011C0758F|nr:hypothetical protein [Sphaerisporangium album]